MAMRLRRPRPEDLRTTLEAARARPLSYGPAGLTGHMDAPSGFRREQWSTTLGYGDDVFARARDTLQHWGVQRGSNLVVLADGPVALGVVVVMSAPLPIGFMDAACRVVSVVDERDRYGFAYGTVPPHPEQGEESFLVRRRPSGEVDFDIVAVSRPRHPLARMCPPITRRLQLAAVHRYVEAMRAGLGDRR